MLLKFTMRNYLLKMEYIEFIGRLQRLGNEFRFITVYRDKLFAVYFNDFTLHKTK